MAKTEYSMVRIRRPAHRDLKLVAALSGESLMQLIERLAREERERMEDAQRAGEGGRFVSRGKEVEPIQAGSDAAAGAGV